MAEGLEAAANATLPPTLPPSHTLEAGPLFHNEPLVEFFATRQPWSPQADRQHTMMVTPLAGPPSLNVSAIRSMADVARATSMLSSRAALAEDAEEASDSIDISRSGSSSSSSVNGGSNGSAGRASDPAFEVPSAAINPECKAFIPQALRGGEEQEGVGDLLGHALAALYVARHGLTVTELMHLLATLREREDLRFCTRVWERRDALLAACCGFGGTAGGTLPLPAFASILLQHSIEVKPHDLARIIKAAQAWAPPGDERLVRYLPLLEHCGLEQQQQEEASSGSVADHVGVPRPAKPTAPGHDGPRGPRRAVLHPLGEEMEAALLQMLVALGVLRVHGGDALVLPLEAEALRETIRLRYIDAEGTTIVAGGSGGGEELWHRAIIHYFQSQPSSLLRRCEELPWHLQVCRQWLALRDFLVDLRAFRAMYGGRLKRELFEYWRLLSEGPLVLPGTLPGGDGAGLLDTAPLLTVSARGQARSQMNAETDQARWHLHLHAPNQRRSRQSRLQLG
jgi:hypothetical protein